jgi:hypothetical protein
MVVAVVLKVEGFAGPGGGDDGDAARVRQVGRERDGAGEADVGEAPSLAGVRQRRPRRAVVVGSAGVAHGMSGVVDRDRWKSLVYLVFFASLSTASSVHENTQLRVRKSSSRLIRFTVNSIYIYSSKSIYYKNIFHN